MPLNKVAEEIQHRIIHIFARDMDGRRATNGGSVRLDRDPNFRDYVWFHEFFHGNDGTGLGASHQTGWTGLVAYHIMQSGISCRLPRTPRSMSSGISFVHSSNQVLAPRSHARHYFDEVIDTVSEAGDKTPYTPFSAYSAASPSPSELNTLEDISPEAL